MPVYTYTTLNDPLSLGANTIARDINSTGQIAGTYVNNGGSHGFLLSGGTYSTLDDPLATNGTFAQGINASGQIVGYYQDAAAIMHGFLYNPNGGTFTTLDDPSGTAATTTASGINATGQIVGSFFMGGKSHGFLLTNGLYATLDDPLGIGGTFAQGINASGQIVGYYLDANGNLHGFLFSGGTYTTLDDPLAGSGIEQGGARSGCPQSAHRPADLSAEAACRLDGSELPRACGAGAAVAQSAAASCTSQ